VEETIRHLKSALATALIKAKGQAAR
jgi:hypothetical protein